MLPAWATVAIAAVNQTATIALAWIAAKYHERSKGHEERQTLAHDVRHGDPSVEQLLAYARELERTRPPTRSARARDDASS